MKINAKVTILFDRDGMSIDVRDGDAAISFLRLRLDPVQACSAMGQLAYTHATLAEVRGLDCVGKKMENQTLAFPLPPEADYPNQKKLAAAAAEAHCPEGWTHDNYFGSQESFFQKDGKPWARVTIRRWVDPDAIEPQRLGDSVKDE